MKPVLKPVLKPMVRAVCYCLLLSLSAPGSWADDEDKVSITELGWMDRNHLQKQVDTIDDIARRQLGVQVRNNRDDLELLQRIVNQGLIGKEERLKLQAMGAVLGNLLVRELGLKWMVYEDKVGRSRAICVEATSHCLFPVTMLSRRMEVGILVNVREVYTNAVEIITPYLPKKPFGLPALLQGH
ncbi:DUF3806 domain-containing protein [Exilibacterium tricleocarpae]|uniref:DUF3806 domain-containing protein n=1 Tax=Exilibacterium tricleocarpae TaxID=2591008 RepID=A0A545TLQ4_9GAMM|nr:DUF3806 domain-containing protein [Exilibacterium tricleocarpae]TQV78081.1 DUF3806 domain-containing protein [Exilibacterium tricleocarpae]